MELKLMIRQFGYIKLVKRSMPQRKAVWEVPHHALLADLVSSITRSVADCLWELQEIILEIISEWDNVTELRGSACAVTRLSPTSSVVPSALFLSRHMPHTRTLPETVYCIVEVILVIGPTPSALTHQARRRRRGLIDCEGDEWACLIADPWARRNRAMW